MPGTVIHTWACSEENKSILPDILAGRLEVEQVEYASDFAIIVKMNQILITYKK